jgi:alkylhydroperoxidase family enzyme
MTRQRRLPDPPTGVARQSVEPWQHEAIAAALGEWQRAVMRLATLDAITTEIVRLRCAMTHDCRFCRTVRLLVDGGRAVDEAAAERIGASDSAAFEPRHAAALQLVDAMTSQPGSIDDALAGELHGHFTAEELLEMTLDVMKFSHQKIKVALGLDEPLRPGGYLVDFSIDDLGRPTFETAR